MSVVYGDTTKYSLQEIIQTSKGNETFAFICATREQCRELVECLQMMLKESSSVCSNSSGIFDNMSAVENVFLHYSSFGRARRRRQYDRYNEIMSSLGLKIPADTNAGSLSNEEKYMLELARLMTQEPEVIILSNISSVLGLGFLKSFFSALDVLKQRGISTIVVSTRWEDIIQFCDLVAVKSGSRENSFTLLRVHDIRQDPRLLYYALADYRESEMEQGAEGIIKSMNLMLDVAVPQIESREMDGRISETMRVIRTQLDAATCTLFFRDEQKKMVCMEENKPSCKPYRLSKSFIEMTMEDIHKISFYSSTKHNFSDIFEVIPSDINLIVCNPVYVLPDKVGIIILMFKENILLTEDQIIMIEMGCNLLGNMLSSSFITTRDIFIEESNHRLKNNLQTIISLLFIKKQLCHANGISSANALEEMDAFIESMVSRIKLIADMHDFISKRRTDISEVSTDEILQTIAANYKGCDVQIIIDTEYILLPYETASVVIMILNELVCNSFKHAFKLKKNDGNNIICIGFKEKGDEIEMFVKDNGSGVENAQSLSDLQKSNSLGMTIVNSLVIKLRASIEFVSENGMSVSVKFRC